MKNKQCFELTPAEQTVTIAGHEPQLVANAADTGTKTKGWKVTKKRGSVSGVGVSVSGAGAFAEMEGSMSFSLQRIESSATYQYLKTTHKFSAGTGGFWNWLVGGVHTSETKTQIDKAFHQMTQSQKVNGTVHVKLECAGLYPNVQADASAYVQVLEITDAQGSSATFFSNGAPGDDVGAQDTLGNDLPTKSNDSSFTL